MKIPLHRRKPALLLVGCGDIAWRLLPWLLPRFRVYALLRNPERAERWRAQGAHILPGDLDRWPVSTRRLGFVRHVVMLAPPDPDGRDDPRGRRLLAMLSRADSSKFNSLPQGMVYISTSGVYGDCGGAAVPETRPLAARNPRALRRVEAEQRLRHWGRSARRRLSILRVPGIYAAVRLPEARLRAGTAALHAAEDSYTNHIHADDLAGIVAAALFRGRPQRVYHACDDSRQKMGDYFDAVADALHLSRPPRISRAEAQQQLSPGLLSFLNESRQLENQRLKRELRYRLRYPTVVEGLRELGVTRGA
ncbi:SDR family NAD(P)-dependent oxidoreductase [Leeia aquatica]|uniref:SDR family NAD(P)-dependent oxidoreductase n=1 Tax=Leeia aquatica TaxID=2725557 RepID=A0A847SC92_9NEIS|nr:SDR family NAD(P)-dependent oxidoreductase [Leeia aquatica]NLR74959.1 SDR family NAD(P)-dependent oxidoreductase [Leeia aquatica]